MSTPEGEIDLLSIWRPIRQGWRYILMTTAIATGVGIVVSFVLPKTYCAETVLLPLSDTPNSVGAAQSIIGGLGLGGMSKTTNQSSKLITVLKSRSLAETAIQDNDFLRRIYEKQWDVQNNRWKDPDPKHQPSLEDAANMLKSNISISSDLEHGTIKVIAQATTPAFAYDIVIAYIKTLQKFIAENALTQAKYKRISIEKQLVGNKRALLLAGKDFLKSTARVSSVESDMNVDLNEDKNFADAFLDGLDDGGLNTMIMRDAISRTKASVTDGDGVALITKVPQAVYLQYLTLQKEILAKTYAMLTQQFELAKIEEAKNDLLFQVIDKPVMPKNKSKPNRRSIVVGFFFVSLLLSMVGSIVLDKVKATL